MEPDRHKLLRQVDETATAWLQRIDSFDNKQLNTLPGPGKWTAAQVANHIYKASGLEPLYGNTAPTDRDPAAKVKAIEDLFLDFTTKYHSPDFILPGNGPFEKDEVYSNAQKSWDEIKKAAQDTDLSLTCMDAEIPGFGKFTRYEMLSFIVTHTRRHLHQLDGIYKAVVQNNAAGKS